MRKTASVLALAWLVLATPGHSESVAAGVDRYVEAWKRFYPSRAVSRGLFDAVGAFEDRSAEAVAAWVEVNRGVEARWRDLSALPLDDAIDARLLRAQARRELELWLHERPHETSPKYYAELISGAFDPLLTSHRLSRAERRGLLVARLADVERLARTGSESVIDGRPAETRQAIELLEGTTACLGVESTESVEELVGGSWPSELRAAAERCGQAVEALAATWRERLPGFSLPDEAILGREGYARRLALYTDSGLTPERLEQMARAEIEESRKAIAELATTYWRSVDPRASLPGSAEEIVARAFADLEANRPETEQGYLLELRRYGREVEAFVREHGIATVPEHQTLSIELAPESAGPLARIGYVQSAPAFHPNPWTTWYLATIPDAHPEDERIDFWSSFNYSFKRFIVIHELFPGHYMQLKILRENPHLARILFPHRPFVEGWATFSERIVLDAGYAEGDLLTRLAQLRKRLENANRAYTSVQAHCNGWSEEEVFAFSVETSRLAPQFAKSLWGRLMRSPMQIVTYMLGGLELRSLYEAERERLGDRFRIRDFMDTILRTGPVATEELAAVLGSESP